MSSSKEFPRAHAKTLSKTQSNSLALTLTVTSVQEPWVVETRENLMLLLLWSEIHKSSCLTSLQLAWIQSHAASCGRSLVASLRKRLLPWFLPPTVWMRPRLYQPRWESWLRVASSDASEVPNTLRTSLELATLSRSRLKLLLRASWLIWPHVASITVWIQLRSAQNHLNNSRSMLLV